MDSCHYTHVRLMERATARGKPDVNYRPGDRCVNGGHQSQQLYQSGGDVGTGETVCVGVGFRNFLLDFAVNLYMLLNSPLNKKVGKGYPKLVALGRCHHPWVVREAVRTSARSASTVPGGCHSSAGLTPPHPHSATKAAESLTQ